MTRRDPHARLWRGVAVGVATILGLALLLVGPPPGAAATLTKVRLEAGMQYGYTFSSAGSIHSSKKVNLTSKILVDSDRRAVIPTRTGTWLRLTTGPLAGYNVRESPVSYIPGKAGEGTYGTAATVTFAAGRYLAYVFESDWSLGHTHDRTVSAPTTATASRRAVINGRHYVLMISGTFAGTWVPVPQARSLTAQPLTCEAPAKVLGGSRQVLTRVTTTERKVALTFDMGGRLTPALDVIERLVIDRVCATIFPTGDAIATAQGAEVMARIADHPALFTVGNHTQNHCNLRDGGGPTGCPTTPPTAERIAAELLTAEAAIRAATGMEPRPDWRPPYGASDSRVRAAAAAVGYTKTIMWDVDTIDWRAVADGGPTASSMTTKVIANARAGSIVLMHLGGWNTFDALPSMVMRLRSNGLQPTTVTDLVR